MPARVPRIYQPCSPLIVGQTCRLSATASHHIVNVLRLSVGSKLLIFNNTNLQYTAQLTNLDKRAAVVQITAKDCVNRESPLQITLAHGLARGEKMDWIIQKAVELGVACFVPVFTQYSNVKLSGDRLTKRYAHWQQVIISASEQCGRNRLMSIMQPMPFSRYITDYLSNNTTDKTLRLLFAPSGAKRLSALDQDASEPIHLLIGPEGGLSTDEIEQATGLGFHSLQLGPRILRTETAALAVVSILQAQLGDL